MIRNLHHALVVQTRRRARGLKGVAKSVRRFIRSEYGVESLHLVHHPYMTDVIRRALEGDFSGCRPYDHMDMTKHEYVAWCETDQPVALFLRRHRGRR
jgi:hypothetical protein